MSYKLPNIKKTRVVVKNDSKSAIMTAKAFKEFIKKYPEHEGVTKSQFAKIINQFHKNIIETVIEEPNGISLPQRIGKIIILAFPTTPGTVIDFGASNKAGERIYTSNWDTDNRMCKIMFFKDMRLIRNDEFWRFTAARNFKRTASVFFKKQWNRYIFIDKGTSANVILNQR